MESPSKHPSAPASRSRRALDLGLLVLFWAVLYLPNHDATEFHKEEGRKAIPAEEMLRTGDLVLPAIWGRPYLTKPPALYWSIAAVSAPAGEVGPGSARLPSILATLGTAAVVYLLAAGRSRTAARCAAGLFLTMPLVFEKGALAEPEALFCLFITLGIALAWRASRAAGRASAAGVLGAGLALGLALLAKGPAALVFHVGGLLGLALVARVAPADRPRARAIVGPLAGSTVVGLLVAGVWVALLARRLGAAELGAYWTAEMAGKDHGGLLDYLARRGRFVLGFGLGCLPAVVLGLPALMRAGRAAWSRVELHRLAASVIAAGLLFFLLYPRSEPRYAYPVLPWLALFSGQALATSLEPGSPPTGARVRDGLVGLLSVVAVLGGLALAALGPLGVLPEIELDALGVALAVALVLVGLLGARFLAQGRARASVLSALFVIVLGRAFQLTQYLPPRAAEEARLARAAEIESALPAGGRLFSAIWGEFNTLAFVHRPIRYTEDPGTELEPGDFLIIAEAQRDPMVGESGWRTLRRVVSEKGRGLLVLERLSGGGREE